MKLMGFDVATVTGICVLEDDKFSASSFRIPRPKSKKPNGFDLEYEAYFANEFYEYMNDLIGNEKPDYIGIERPLPGNIRKGNGAGGTTLATTYRLNGLVYLLSQIGLAHESGVISVSQSQWRSLFLGVTTGGRDFLKKKAFEKCQSLGISVENHDQSDAVGIVHYMQETLFPKQHEILFDKPCDSVIGSSAIAV